MLSREGSTLENEWIRLEIEVKYGVLVEQKEIGEKHYWLEEHPQGSGKQDPNLL